MFGSLRTGDSEALGTGEVPAVPLVPLVPVMEETRQQHSAGSMKDTVTHDFNIFQPLKSGGT